ncbi:MAG: UDP-N-acetylmuramoyl-L-alanyl-D-glutamate--2,6-diaminopimelate ligase [Spirochaetales bacterium]|nr:UDP-N-acetylmuramoyl-L-alanyl-D-glutamate--2,6-diaminopimelate ligase [Spirochaetales bacterium]
MKKLLSELCVDINVLSKRGPDPEIAGIFYDSRRVCPGSLFVATDGIHTDGHEYIGSAQERGAVAILHSKDLSTYEEGVAYIKTENPRLDLSPLAAAFYDHPGDRMKIIGVTGTDGKTSTVFLIHQLLQLAGLKSGFLSTATYQAGGGIEKNPYRQSTPEAPEVQELLSEMAGAGCEYGVIESTSHGLSPLTGRLSDVNFKAGVFTNITHEHLEFHGTFENYRKDKSRLFEKAGSGHPPGFSILNRDDPSWEYMKGASGPHVFTYSKTNEKADIFCTEIRADQEGSDIRLKGLDLDAPVRLNIPGSFSVENTMAALLTVHHITGKSYQELLPLLPKLSGVKGRMKMVDRGQPFTVIVDYAHTPGAFEKLLPSVKETTPGRVIAVFGSAGERDKVKRPMQGEIAGRWCDILVLTDEDPRGDDSMSILKDIGAGCKKTEGEDLFLISSRPEAFDKAFSIARKGDTVLLLGKGHETSIIYEKGSIPWDEEETAKERLALLGYKEKK